MWYSPTTKPSVNIVVTALPVGFPWESCGSAIMWNCLVQCQKGRQRRCQCNKEKSKLPLHVHIIQTLVMKVLLSLLLSRPFTQVQHILQVVINNARSTYIHVNIHGQKKAVENYIPITTFNVFQRTIFWKSSKTFYPFVSQ